MTPPSEVGESADRDALDQGDPDRADLERLAAARPSWAARFVAGALTPANVVGALMGLVSLRHTSSVAAGVGWWALAMALVVGLPLVILAWALRTGKAADRQVVRRSQRPWLSAAAAGCVLSSLVVLAVAGAPTELTALIASMVVGVSAVALVSLVWKASVHVAVMTGAALVATLEVPRAGAWAFVLVPVVAWARWRDGRHSRAQLLGGAVLGGVTAATYALLR